MQKHRINNLMKRLILTLSLCTLFLSGFSQIKNVYSASFPEPGYPNIRDLKKIIDSMMHGLDYTIESSRLETGTDTLVGYFGIIKSDSRPMPLYSLFLTNHDTLITGQLGFMFSKDTLNYLKTEVDLGLSQYSNDKIHLSLKYNPDNKTVLYKWGSGLGNNIAKLQVDIDNIFKVGNEFPALKIKELEGPEIGIKDLKEKIVVVNWWHTGCGPCIAEMPGLNELVDTYRKRGDILFLAIADNTVNQLKDFLKKREFKYKQGLSTEATKEILKGGYPQHLIMDKNGKIAFYMTGGSADAAKTIKREIDKLMR